MRSLVFAAAILAQLAPALAEQRTATFAGEAVPQAQGVDWSWPVPNAITINAVHGNVSIGFPNGFVPATTAQTPVPGMMPAPFAEALVNCWIAAGTPAYSSDVHAYFAGPSAPGLGDFGARSVYVTPGQAVPVYGDGPPTPGGLFSVILKTSPPAGKDTPFGDYGMSLPVAAGSFIVCHADVGGSQGGTPIDVEFGMSVDYQPQAPSP